MLEPCPHPDCRELSYDDEALYCSSCDRTFVQMEIEMDEELEAAMESLRKAYSDLTDDQIINKAIVKDLER